MKWLFNSFLKKTQKHPPEDTYSEEHLRTCPSENVFMKMRKIENYLLRILILCLKTGFFNIDIRNKRKC